MKITALSPASSAELMRPGRLDGFARTSLFRLLSRIEGGLMVVTEGNSVSRFGTPDPHGELPDLHVSITVHNPAFYRLVLLKGSIGAGEAYMLGFWDSSDLTAAVRLMCRNMAQVERMDGGLTSLGLLVQRFRHWLSPNSPSGSRRNVRAHYDLSNDLFEYFLDSRMMYSAAIYPDNNSDLEAASKFKLHEVGRKLELEPADHVLEIGSGWGGMAIYLAETFGCRITTTTISRQQFDYVNRQVSRRNLEQKITVLDKDYRELDGHFDKLVSIEMVEAVGQRYLSTYFRQCNDLLKRGGKMLLQAITIPEQRYDYAKRNVDFIQRYIFPGGSLPSVEAILSTTGKFTNLQVARLDDIGQHYARTLGDWHTRFMRDPERVRQLGFDDVFIRLWQFYLCYCEGGFRERAISTSQIVFRKN